MLASAQRPDLVELALRQGRRLTRLIGDLLDVSRIDAGRYAHERTAVELEALVREVVERFDPDLVRAKCNVSVKTIAGGPFWGRWDRSQIDQAITNFLSNAIKFGKGNPIELELDRHGGRIRLSVRDHGIGIDPMRRPHLFERFARGVPARNYGGLGLGLYISRRIVQMHGGEISVDNAPGGGAIATLALPMA